MNSFSYHEIKPSKTLRKYIDCFWHYNYINQPTIKNQPEIITQVVPPDPCPSLVFYFHKPSGTLKTFIGGPSEQSFAPKTPIDCSYTAIKFLPGVLDTLFDVNSKDITNRVIDVSTKIDFIDPHVICKELTLKQTTISHLNNACSHLIETRRPKLNPLVIKALKLIHHHKAQINVAQLAQKLKISRRQLQRKLKDKTGLNPSSMIRLIKIRASMKDIILHNKSVIETAYKYGYTDQPHLINHLKKTTGINANAQMTYFNRVNPVID